MLTFEAFILSDMADNRLGAGANTTSYVYSLTSTLKSVTLPNDVVDNYGYDTLDPLKSLVTKKNITTLESFTYTMCSEGNSSPVVELGGRTVADTYDNAYRLLCEILTDASVSGVLGCMHDVVGKWRSRTSTVSGIPAMPAYTMTTWTASKRLPPASRAGAG